MGGSVRGRMLRIGRSRHEALGESIASLHTWLGDAILWVAGLHAVAGLYHHFILKDRALLPMLPERRP
jgi:cytochrome b561